MDDLGSRLNRRLFLQTGMSGAAAVGMTAHRAAVAEETAEVAAQIVPGKQAGLIVHGSDVVVLETPPALLASQITPLDVLFVRNNQRLANSATLRPTPLTDWRITLAGEIDAPRTLDAAQLPEMEQVEHEMVLQCCGNQRALFAGTVKAKGTQWTRGGMGNIRVTGVRLSTVLDQLGVHIRPQARFVTAGGKDTALEGKQDFEHSLPLGDVLEHSLLAWKFNGQPIPTVHGGPVRLMTPGYFGTMHIKWLDSLRFEQNESENYNHLPRYRTPRRPLAPGEQLTYTLANSKACWRMKLKSVVLAPEPGATVRANQPQLVRGVAFNDGAARIDDVLVSVDRGKTWSRARLETPRSRYAWYRWSAQLSLPAGNQEIWTRAVDAWGRSQPLDGSIHWNPSGYEWNGVEKIPVVVT